VRTCETCDEVKVTEHFARNKRGERTYECWSCYNERMLPARQQQAAKEWAARLKKLGLPPTATDAEVAAAESAAAYSGGCDRSFRFDVTG